MNVREQINESIKKAYVFSEYKVACNFGLIPVTYFTLRPANFFYDALGLKTVMPGEGLFSITDFDSNVDMCDIAIKAPTVPQPDFAYAKKLPQVSIGTPSRFRGS